MLPLFYNLRRTLRLFLSKKSIILQIFACCLTYVIVISRFDWIYFNSVHVSPLSPYLFPAVIIGALVPIFGIPLFYIVAKISKRKNMLIITWALAQAAMLGWFISSLYKAFTGRIEPPHVLASTMVDASRNWNFGFFEHGIFWGWPSSHTTVAFAMSCALIALYPRQKVVMYSALIYALYIGLGITTQIHWFSEFIAGAVIGAIIGTIVGESFKGTLSTVKNI